MHHNIVDNVPGGLGRAQELKDDLSPYLVVTLDSPVESFKNNQYRPYSPLIHLTDDV